MPVDGILPEYTLLERLTAVSGESSLPPDLVALQDGLVIDSGDNLVSISVPSVVMSA